MTTPLRAHIRRTSEYGEGKPCDAAYKAEGWITDRRTFTSAAEHDARFPDRPWLSEGKHHRPYPGGIARDLPRERWYFDVPDLDALRYLILHYGQLVIGPDYGDADMEIEIYDGYRE